MKIRWLLFFLGTVMYSNAQKSMNKSVLFDDGWRFSRGDNPGAQASGFNDQSWRTVDLPHDWSIEDMPGTSSPFSPDAISKVSGGFTTGGTGWYRKTFSVPASQKSGRTVVLFEGVYMNADIWVNGRHMGNHPYGYTSFWYDITDSLEYGKSNTLAVRVRNEGENSRWYAGSGIYRHVWLKTFNPVHIQPWGVSITTPQVSAAKATVFIRTKMLNESPKGAQIKLVTRLLDSKGKEVSRKETAQLVSSNDTPVINQQLNISSPSLWSPGSPVLYTAITEVFDGTVRTGSEKTVFGIRSVAIDAVNGLRINGKSLKLKGGCVHHDNGPLGAKAFNRAEERKVALLQASGYNAVRCSHNPPSPAFLEACDRLGMLVIDEAFDTWNSPKNKQDYNVYFNDWWQRDLQSMVYRDQNHPSVIMWSIGNEIPHREKPEVAALARKLSSYIHTLDPTRPVTAGVNGVGEDKDPFFSALDVAGYNYDVKKYDSDHIRLPDRVIFATESFPLESFDYWMGVIDHPWVIGDFVWTAFDYIGEASIGWLGYPQNRNFYPWNLAYCGDIDICGWKRPQSFYRDAFWGDEPTISLFVHPPVPTFSRTNPKPEPWSRWNWQDVTASWSWQGYEAQPLDVTVYSSCDEAELFLNGKSLGRRPTNRAAKYMAVWQVPYQPGALKAIGYKQGKQVSSSELNTAAAPDKIRLTADRSVIDADGQDLSYITVELLDTKGFRNPRADNLIKFDIEGPGTIIGVGNANPESVESNQLPKRKSWQGRCLVIIRAARQAGKVTLKASADGLKSSAVSIAVK